MNLEMHAVKIEVPGGCNVILGQTHFIKTVEDLYEIMVTSAPQAAFGLAFAEASGPCLVRTEGNDEKLVQACAKNIQAIGAGHTFIIIMKNAYPISVLNQVKNCPEVCRVFCATSNPVEVVVASTTNGWGVMGVIDGSPPKGIETDKDRQKRREFLRSVGYKR